MVRNKFESLDKGNLKKRGLIFSGRHIPYNPKLTDRARWLRKHMTKEEKKLWKDCLCDFSYRVFRQRPIDNYIVDFYCPSLGLVVEVDGSQHDTEEGVVSDSARSSIINKWGLTVLRFANKQVMDDFEDVVGEIIDYKLQCEITTPSLNKGGGVGVGS